MPQPFDRVAGSFRDPAGFVFSRDGVLYRQVNRRFAAAYDRLIGSGLYDDLARAGLLVAHDEVDVEPATAEAYKILRPQRVPFVSFPYEWSPGQLRDAALATLDAHELAMDAGMSLRDASAYNVQFLHGRPVLIDTLSFEPWPQGRPWVAYRQYCQHFLAPLALACHTDVRLLRLLRDHLDGIPLDLAAALLPARTRVTPGLAVHLHAHARSQRRHAAGDGASGGGGGHFSERAFRGLVDSLRATVAKQTWEPAPSAWRDYYAAKESYSDESAEHKAELVAKLLEELRPETVWDLGANTGRFSRLAARTGSLVVSLEMDPSAVEVSWRQVRDAGERGILPLVVDLANPSPALGWEHRERPSLTDRGPADAVLALAVVHHLAIAGNVPLERIASWLGELGGWVLLEWVPKDDPMVQRLLASREDVFDGYTVEGFEAAVAGTFTVDRREPLRGSARSLYLLRRR
ncbi:MAG: class I SAM-dependent methyltransferase [Euzebyales bacterium]|nr:class I SAM-dependent methyltransferase [Euzebyales bacterium]